jgi:hypothetical protein
VVADKAFRAAAGWQSGRLRAQRNETQIGTESGSATAADLSAEAHSAKADVLAMLDSEVAEEDADIGDDDESSA